MGTRLPRATAVAGTGCGSRLCGSRQYGSSTYVWVLAGPHELRRRALRERLEPGRWVVEHVRSVGRHAEGRARLGRVAAAAGGLGHGAAVVRPPLVIAAHAVAGLALH